MLGGGANSNVKIEQIALIDDLQMEDLGYKGQMHTWSNNRRGNIRIVERLSRVLGNRIWCQKFPKAQCINELAIGSNQSHVMLALEHSDTKGRRRFKFKEMWLEKAKCLK